MKIEFNPFNFSSTFAQTLRNFHFPFPALFMTTVFARDAQLRQHKKSHARIIGKKPGTFRLARRCSLHAFWWIVINKRICAMHTHFKMQATLVQHLN